MSNLFFICLFFFVLFYIGCGGSHSTPPLPPIQPPTQIVYSYASLGDGSFLLLNDKTTVLIFQD